MPRVIKLNARVVSGLSGFVAVGALAGSLATGESRMHSATPAKVEEKLAALPSSRVLTAREIYNQASAHYALLHSYIARMVRRDLSANHPQEEILAFYARREPWSVRFKWLEGLGEGREVLYVKDHFENKIHVVLAAGDVFLVPGGKKLSLDVNSPLVKRASRESVTEAGIGPMIERFGDALDASERIPENKMTVMGIQKRPDYDEPLLLVEQRLPPKVDRDVPRGGRRLLGFHPVLHLPVFNVLTNEVGQEVSHYRFDRLQLDPQLDDADFDPASIGPRSHYETPPTSYRGPELRPRRPLLSEEVWER